MLSYLKKLLFGEEGINEELVKDVLTKLNKDVARQIIMELEDKDVFKICSLDEAVGKDICDNAFYYNRMMKNYPNLIKFKPENLSWKKYYLRSVQYISLLDEEYNFKFSKTSKADPIIYYEIISKENIEADLERAAQLGLKDLVEYYLESGEDVYTGNLFSTAVQGNDKSTIYYLLKLDNIEKDWNIALYKSAANKNRTLINLFLEKGANVNEGLQGAALSGDMSLINFFIEKGANDWNKSISAASRSEKDNKKVIAFFIDKAEKEGIQINWKIAILSAARAGNLDLVKFFSNQTYLNKSYLGTVVAEALKGPNSQKIIEFLISKGFDNWQLGENYAKIYNKDMIPFFLQKMN